MKPSLNGRWSALLSDPFEAVRQEIAGAVASPKGAMSAWEDDAHYFVEMDLPGVCEEDIDVSVEKSQLMIRATRRLPDAGRRNWYEERPYGAVQRIVQLNDGFDAESIEATLDSGVLKLRIAKKPEHRPRRIAVRGEKPQRLETN